MKRMHQPYKPSWIDRFNGWVLRLPMRAWIFYVILGIALLLFQMLVLWLEGGSQESELLPIIIFNSFAVPYLLVLIVLLDNQAVTAFNSLKPALDVTDSEFDDYEYQLSTMPFLVPLIAGFILMAIAILIERLAFAPLRYALLEQYQFFTVAYQAIDKLSAFLFGVFIYHSIRQLRLVNNINSHHVGVNLFNSRPLQAFSRLTASTAVLLVIGMYGWLLINPELLTHPAHLGFVALNTILAVAVFVWPLYGIHKLMVEAKETALHDIDLRFEEVFSKFNKKLQNDDFSANESLNGTISSLEIQYRRVAAIPTWPWRPETARFALTAIALPLLLMVLRFLVEQAFGI